MHENAGWFNPDTGIAPTHQQMLAALTNLNGLVIAAEFVYGLEDDISGLDNVVLIPEPATLFLLAMGASILRKKRIR